LSQIRACPGLIFIQVVYLD